jgi:spore coat polysaccharide biosynthesis protein SpsF
MATFDTEQEEFWAGDFGDGYIDRNNDDLLFRSNIDLFAKILRRTRHVNSIIEFGPNIGLNLKAIKTLVPNINLAAVEINENAVSHLKNIPELDVYQDSILNFSTARTFDLSLVKTVLIHIPPLELPKVYSLLYETSKRYICIAEYYSQNPVEVLYRGHTSKLFKRDFAGEMLDTYPDLSMVDYGFVYSRDNNFPQDDVTWFLLEKGEK